MKAWTLLGTAPIPGGEGDLRLLQRDTEFALRLKDNDLMNSRLRGSEEALARLALAALGSCAAPRVLVGGFGMGFTLRAALDALEAAARVDVVELVPAVVAWGRGPLAHLSGHSLDDPRVTVREGDVGRILAAARSVYEVILLDVDNGPQGVTRGANDGLYGAKGIAAARAALRPGGVMAVWSAGPDAPFSARLRRGGFTVAEHTVRAQAGRGARHCIWVARRS